MEPTTSPKDDSTKTQTALDDLIKQAAAKDAIKDYNAAAELYSEATELQAELNGELALENADLLFAYGKALYNVAVSKSDVLGSKVAGESQPSSASVERPSAAATATTAGIVEKAVAQGPPEKSAGAQKSNTGDVPAKPYFQFTGDENFDDSDSEDEADGEEAAADDEDDFANAFEVLDLARVLYHKKMTTIEEGIGKGKSADLPPDLRHVKERLADTYDLQAEISLEAERFLDAVTDLRTSLDLRQSLFPIEDPSVAECHYKLSLALEFGSVKNENDSSQEDSTLKGPVDEEMREEAAAQMEKAIESCRLRMDQEQKKLVDDNSLDEDKVTAMKRRIANVKDIIADMEQRLVDLRRPPVSATENSDADNTVLKGILGQIMGHSPSEQKAHLDAVTKEANDLSAFVKRKPASKKPPQKSETVPKRSAPEEGAGGDTKRARAGDNLE
ncbi:tetratricopeptide repeat domain protein [Aspergillus costaricaensis CBS 115574]|uniref:Tetratricopeptide repeat domain protein n=1 Tax=Aspergillus costaricaensis CBS 115574 TaxID=1448317 RepID=A0ACD1HYJ1_9EURO|nr:tetratricopeptide repeat domain protein [Aspergillus costaricaensis CBS 115574]RAK83382.1 tetratricopeptide repeat domain protein [Aspergillus costaricaensis CBS 115574]